LPSVLCELAIDKALHYGNALLKFISSNDAGVTGAHQYGFYLPKAAWPMYSPYPPEKGENKQTEVEVIWQDDRVTHSRVKWYGAKTRSEYRLTRFGKDFPYFNPDAVGDLLVIVPENHERFFGFVLDLDEDVEEIQAALGLQGFDEWSIYLQGAPQAETEDECLDRNFREFVAPLTDFPTGEAFSAAARKFVEECLKNFKKFSIDKALLTWMETEWQLYQMAERGLCQAEIVRPFKDVDDFLKTAASLMNRRKTRAGRSFENHVDFVLNEAKIPHKMRPAIDGKPDIVIPSEEAYFDKTFPRERVMIVGLKRTCKDRWRQVLNEGKLVPKKHILTMQPSISKNQLQEMHEAGLSLIVPQPLIADYPTDHDLHILNVGNFLDEARKVVS
jgi:hypothetical protein